MAFGIIFRTIAHYYVSIYIVAEMIKPCMSNFGENDFFSRDFVLTKFRMSICKNILLMKLT